MVVLFGSGHRNGPKTGPYLHFPNFVERPVLLCSCLRGGGDVTDT